MKDFQEVTMSSLIAGYFLSKGTRIIEFNAITNLLNDLYMCENIDVMETDEDIDKLGIIILFDDKSLILNYDFNEIVNINGTNIMICEYLYGLTNEWVRNYFNVDENHMITNTRKYHIIRKGKKKYYLIKMN